MEVGGEEGGLKKFEKKKIYNSYTNTFGISCKPKVRFVVSLGLSCEKCSFFVVGNTENKLNHHFFQAITLHTRTIATSNIQNQQNHISFPKRPRNRYKSSNTRYSRTSLKYSLSSKKAFIRSKWPRISKMF